MTTDADPPRGRHILAAAVQLIAAEGLAGLSIRAVAAAAGVSVAQVQYYFHTKETLIEAAFDHAAARFQGRLAAVLARPRSRRRLQAAIALWLPLDEEREQWVKVWLAFIGAAAIRPELAGSVRHTDQAVLAWLTDELQALGVADATSAAARLLAMIDGVALRCLTLPARARPAFIRTTLTQHVDDLTRSAAD